MSSATVSVTASVELPNGHRKVYGTVTGSNSYISASGDTMDLSGYFSGNPWVKVVSTTAGYQIYHNQGTAAAAVIKIWQAANANASSGLTQITLANAANAAGISGTFEAIGVAV